MIDIDAALMVSTVSVATCLDQGLEMELRWLATL
jgi:hypothetical protein